MSEVPIDRNRSQGWGRAVLRKYLKPFTVTIISAYFIYARTRFLATNNYADTRKVGIVEEGYCTTSLIRYSVSSIDVSDKNDQLPICISSESAQNKDNADSCVSAIAKSSCANLLSSYIALNLDYSCNEESIASNVDPKSIHFVVYDVWIIIFAIAASLLTIVFDFTLTYKWVSQHINNGDILNIRRFNNVVVLCLLGFLVATIYSYTFLRRVECQDAYYSAYPDDHFCSILNSCAVKLAVIIAPTDILVDKLGIITIVLTILVVISLIFHTAEETRNVIDNSYVNINQRETNFRSQELLYRIQNISPTEAEYLLTGRNLDGSDMDMSQAPNFLIERNNVVKKWKYLDLSSLQHDFECAICLGGRCRVRSESANNCIQIDIGVDNTNASLEEISVEEGKNGHDDEYGKVLTGNSTSGSCVNLEGPIENGNVEDETLAEVTCGHKFHKSCIMMWAIRCRIGQSITCPICRSDL